jgi:PAS domain S-box-containing protein
MREGAWDYILKDRLQRLPNAVITAIERYTTEKQRRKYVDELMVREALMKGAERLARFGSWQANMITGINTWSDEMYRMMGYEPGSRVPSTELFLAGIHHEDYTRIKATYDYACNHMPNVSFECRLSRDDGSIMYIYSELEIKRNAFSEIVSLNGFIRDVTENREAKQKLAESERKYQYLFEHSPKPTWVIDAETSRFLDVNKAAVHHYGYTYDEFIAMQAYDIIVPPSGHRDTIWENGKWPEKAMALHRKKDGTVISVEQQTGNVDFEGRPARIILATEIN